MSGCMSRLVSKNERMYELISEQKGTKNVGRFSVCERTRW